MYVTYLERHNIIVDRASDRIQRLKDARSEAEKEIAAYRAEKEEEFKRYEKSVRILIYVVISEVC